MYDAVSFRSNSSRGGHCKSKDENSLSRYVIITFGRKHEHAADASTESF